jgi:peptide/nickel transport system substrate-binding protein
VGGYGDRAIIQVYELLVDIGPDSPEPVPMLATQVPTRENGSSVCQALSGP